MKTRDLIYCALFAALTAIGAFIHFQFMHATITLQCFFTAMAGLLLGARLGALSQALYVGLGLVGLPIFAAGGGFSYVFNPTFGFLLGLIPAAWVIGRLAEKNRTPLRLALACAAGFAVLYAIGLPYIALIVNVYNGGAVSAEPSSTGGTSVTVTTGGQESDFYIAILPVNFSKGILVQCYDVSGFQVCERRTSGELNTVNAAGLPIIANLGSIQEWLDNPKPTAVDLGLSVKWASFNLGASTPEGSGDYFSWGETAPKSSYSWSTYAYGQSKTGPFSEYVLDPSFGTVDYKTVLDLEDENEGCDDEDRDGGPDIEGRKLPGKFLNPCGVIEPKERKHKQKARGIKNRREDHLPAETFVLMPPVQHLQTEPC